MADFDKKQGTLKCEFDKKSRSATLMQGNEVIATGPLLETPLLDKLMFSNPGHYVGDSVKKPLPELTGNKGLDMTNFALAQRDDGFEVITGKTNAADKKDGVCNVDLVDGRSFKNVPMTFKAPSPAGP